MNRRSIFKLAFGGCATLLLPKLKACTPEPISEVDWQREIRELFAGKSLPEGFVFYETCGQTVFPRVDEEMRPTSRSVMFLFPSEEHIRLAAGYYWMDPDESGAVLRREPNGAMYVTLDVEPEKYYGAGRYAYLRGRIDRAVNLLKDQLRFNAGIAPELFSAPEQFWTRGKAL